MMYVEDYLEEVAELLSLPDDSIYNSWVEYDGEVRTVTVSDRLHDIAGIFLIEGWKMPNKLSKYNW